MKQPLAIWVTDTHLSDNTIEINFRIFLQIFNLCDEMGVKTIFHGGDIFTARKGQPEMVLNAFKSTLDQAAERGIHIYAIAGNHDKTDYTSDSSYLEAFNGHPALTVLEAGSRIMYDSVNVFFLPYYDESLTYTEKLAGFIDAVPDGECNVLLTHVGIDGVKNNGHVNVQNELKPGAFDKFNLVLVGHYHNRQMLGNNIVYTGSAYQANFGEDGDKGCTLLYDDGSFEFIQLEFPQYITVDLIPSDLDADMISMIKEKQVEAKIRVRINDEVGDDKKGAVAELEAIGVKVEAQKASFSPVEKIGAAQVSFTDNDILTSYNDWGVERKIENAEFGKTLLMEVL